MGSWVDASAQDPARVTDIEDDIVSRIDALKRDGVAEERLQRVKARLVALDAARDQSSFERAKRIGLAAIAGLPAPHPNATVAELLKVPAERVRDTVERYLSQDRRTVVALQR